MGLWSYGHSYRGYQGEPAAEVLAGPTAILFHTFATSKWHNGDMIYHVVPTSYKPGDDLLSLERQIGEFEATELYSTRWPESAALATYHVSYVHCFSTMSDAEEHQAEYGGLIVEIDDTDLDVEIDKLEFAHPMIRDYVPGRYVRVLAT